MLGKYSEQLCTARSYMWQIPDIYPAYYRDLTKQVKTNPGIFLGIISSSSWLEIKTASQSGPCYGDYTGSQLYSSTLWMSQDFNQIWSDYDLQGELLNVSNINKAVHICHKAQPVNIAELAVKCRSEGLSLSPRPSLRVWMFCVAAAVIWELNDWHS